jgi:hypothetical protein
MKLADLAPEFCMWQDIRRGSPGVRPAGGEWGDPYWATFVTHGPDITLAEAQGLRFRCPCQDGHLIQIGFEGRGLEPHQASQARDGKASRWVVAGTGLADLTLSPSIDCVCWHGWVRDGEVINA